MRSIAFSAAWSSLKEQRGENLLAESQEAYFSALYQRYYPAVLAFLQFLTGTQQGAEDLASLVFEKTWLHLAELQDAETAGPWLFRVARNCAVDYFRRNKPIASLEQLLPTEHPQATSSEEAAIAREEERILLAHLGLLTERERVVIGLKFAVGLTNRDIARILSVPEGSVGSMLYRALRRLRAALKEGGPSL
jgi:RNA polymerase sigma-70 factor (ECF subfamily)